MIQVLVKPLAEPPVNDQSNPAVVVDKAVEQSQKAQKAMTVDRTVKRRKLMHSVKLCLKSRPPPQREEEEEDQSTSQGSGCRRPMCIYAGQLLLDDIIMNVNGQTEKDAMKNELHMAPVVILAQAGAT